MVRISELRMREVINVLDGKRLGNIEDIDIDLDRGNIRAIILPNSGRILGMFSRGDGIVVPWENIKKIGMDVILVEVGPYSGPSSRYDYD